MQEIRPAKNFASNEVKQAILPIAGLGTRFFPLSKGIPKELFPLADKPVIQYILQELLYSNIREIVFVVSPGPKKILEFLKKDHYLEKILKERKKNHILEEIKKLQNLLKGFSFSFVLQKKPLGDGHAVLQAKKLIKDRPCAVLFCDDIVDSEVPAILQLINVFKTCQRPVVALKKISREKLPYYGVVKVEKIASRLYKIKGFVEKPEIDQAPSNLAIVGKYIIIPEVFDYLKKAKLKKKEEIHLSEVMDNMVKDGKLIYGYEIKGRWLECGDKIRWLRSNLYFALKHPQFGPELKKYLKEIT